MIAQVVRQLVQDNLSLLRMILAPGRFAVEHGFAVGDQRRELIFETEQVSPGFTKVLAFVRDALLQGLVELAEKWNREPGRPFIGFLSTSSMARSS